MDLLDTAVSVVLFIGMLGWLWLVALVGGMTIMAGGQRIPGPLGYLGLVIAVVGVWAGGLAVYVIAAVLAWRADGPTFFYAPAAAVVGTVLLAGVWLLGVGLMAFSAWRRGEFDGRRSRLPAPASVPTPPSAAVSHPARQEVTGPATIVYRVQQRFDDRPGPIEIGVEEATGRRFIRTRMPQRNGEFLEYHGIDLATYERLRSDAAAALAYAEQCRAGEHAEMILPLPGWSVTAGIAADRLHLERKIALLLSDRPTAADGVAVAGFLPGTPKVRIVDPRVGPDGDLAVALLDDPRLTFRIDARQLAL